MHKIIDKNSKFIILAVLAVVAAAFIIGANSKNSSGFSSFLKFNSSRNEVVKKAIDYINSNNLAGPGQSAELGGVSEESGNIKVQVKIGPNTFDSYISKDGRFLFPRALDLNLPLQGQLPQIPQIQNQDTGSEGGK